MKKIININFHSRVIPIEETAYEILQQYIASLRRYFANEEGRDEIISDIENRFAELFTEALKKGAPCVTDADVNGIIASMGRPEEFEAQEAETVHTASGSEGSTGAAGASGAQSAGAGQQNWQYATESRRLYRAENDKILGGVCAGLANYLKIDPAIVRILFVLLTTGWGAGLLVYIILWMVLPTRALPAVVRKRLYRNPDHKVIGGVAGGIAAYFHIEVWIPRLIFCLPLILGIVSSIFSDVWFPWHWGARTFFTDGLGGSLFVTYIVLWIVLPEAVTASEKLEMRGEKVDLESIKNTIKSDLQGFKGRAAEVGAEMRDRFQDMGSQWKQSAQNWSATEAGPAIRRTTNGFGHAVGVLFKAFFLFIAGVIAFALIMVLAALMFRGGGVLHIKAFILEGFWQNFLAWAAFFLFLVIPVIALLTWLIRRISGTRSRSHYLGYTFATLWIIGLFAMIVLCGMVINNFRSRQHIEQAVDLSQPSQGKMVVRTLRPINRYDDTDWWFDADWGRNAPFFPLDDDSVLVTTVRVKILKSDDSSFHVSLLKISRGSSGTMARDLAGDIRFPVSQQDSLLNLPQGFTLTRGDKFRNQQVLVLVSVPVGKRIQVSSSVEDYTWFNIDPSRRHIHWDNDDDGSRDWDEDIPNVNSYPWEGNVEYRMTASGLVRTDKGYNAHAQDNNRKYEDRSKKDQQDRDDDDNNDDDDPGYKSKKSTPAKPDNGGYRYKGAGSQGADTPVVKKTAMTIRPESYNLLSVLDRV